MEIYQNEKTELSVCLEIERYFDTINHKYKEDKPSSSSSVSSASSAVYTHQHQQPPPQLPLHPHAQYYQRAPPMNVQLQSEHKTPALQSVFVDFLLLEQPMQIPDVDPMIRLLVNQLDFSYAQLFTLLPRCRDLVAKKFPRILSEVERKLAPIAYAQPACCLHIQASSLSASRCRSKPTATMWCAATSRSATMKHKCASATSRASARRCSLCSSRAPHSRSYGISSHITCASFSTRRCRTTRDRPTI